MDDYHIEFRKTRIPIYFITKGRQRFQTRKYWEITRHLNERTVKHATWSSALHWFFQEDTKIPQNEKQSIERIGVSEANRIFVIEAGETASAYRNLLYLAERTGWYFYLTGLDIGKSVVCFLVDNIPRRYSIEDVAESWSVGQDVSIRLVCIGPGPNAICFLLSIGSVNILLDAGLQSGPRRSGISRIVEHADHLDAVFLSHSHYDHYRGLQLVLEEFPNTPLLCSKSTMDFFAFRTADKKWSTRESDIQIVFSDSTRKTISNWVGVTSGNRISFDGGEIRFFTAGHMPGALMLYVATEGFEFLYTGDFTFFDYFPIQGIKTIAPFLPKTVDFVLLDAAMGHVSYSAPGHMFRSLFHRLESKARGGHKVLITADPSSSAIVMYLSIFNHFRHLQVEHEFEDRPTLVLGRETLEYARIVQQRVEDLHPAVRKRISSRMNPFKSAIARFCSRGREIRSSLSEDNVVFIFGPPDFSYGIVQDLLREIGTDKNNLIYLAGALRSQDAIELASGNNNITIRGKPIQNQAEVFNVQNPQNTLNLHADFLQIEKLIDVIRPKRVGLFHNTPRALVPVRAKLTRNGGLEDTYAVCEEGQVISLR